MRSWARVIRLAASGLVLLSLVVPFGCAAREEASLPDDVRPVILGVSRESLSGLAYIARDHGSFSRAGLDVTFVEYSSSQLAFEALISGEVDAALCADTPIVRGALTGRPVRVIATIATAANDIKFVARRSAGIATPADLAGKRIGTRAGTAAHFFMDSALLKYGLRGTDVEVTFGSFEEVLEGLLTGEIDAIATRQPFVRQAQTELGADALVLEEHGLYEKTMNLCVRTDTAVSDREVRGRLVDAFIDAEGLAVADPDRVRRAVADELELTLDDICDCILVDGAVALRQSLVLNFEAQARWARAATDVDGSAPLNCLALIDTSVLEQIDPDRVTIVR